MKVNEIYKGDCLKIMKDIDSKSIQLILTSPPYNASYRNDDNKYPIADINDNKSEKEYIEWTIDIFKEYERILKDKGVVAYNMSYTTKSPHLPLLTISEIIKNTEFTLVDTICWKKKNVFPMTTHPNRLTRICELVYILVRKDFVNNFECNKNVSSISKKNQKYYNIYYNFLEARNNDGCVDIHKATYSTEFANFFIDLYSFEDSIVLDNFIGTGTTAISCINLNRKYIGIDMCEEYVEFTKDRIKNLK